MQLENASRPADQQPPKHSRIVFQHAPQRNVSQPAAPREADALHISVNRVTNCSRQGAHTFPRRTQRRPTWSLRSSEGQLSGLWNPVNSSAFYRVRSRDLKRGDCNTQFFLGQALYLKDGHHSILPDLTGIQGRELQSNSSVRVEVSQPSSSASSPEQVVTSASLPRPQVTTPRKPTPICTPPNMSPHPSLQSDTPSKRPPTPAKDLEYGIPNPPAPHSRSRTPSRHSRQASSTKSNIPWNPTHPCYPHPNPHIPLASPLYSTTRIIRIPRDWMLAGDLAPTFSNTYPEILEPWVSETDFRLLIKNINDGLLSAFSPFGWRTWMDAVLGVATGWIWEDLGFTAVKSKVKRVEECIEEWNGQRRNTLEKDEDGELVRAIPLRRTGYLCLDIQIPDPQVGIVEDEEPNGEANGGVLAAEGPRKI